MQEDKMEKQILIPIIVVLGLLTFGIGVLIYLRCRQRNMINDLENSSVNELGIEQNNKEKNKYDEISVDNEKEFSYTGEVIIDKSKRRREERKKKIDRVLKAVENWADFNEAAAERERERLDRMIDNSRAISRHLDQAIKTSEQIEGQFHDIRESNNSSALLNQGAFTTLATMTNNNNNQRGS